MPVAVLAVAGFNVAPGALVAWIVEPSTPRSMIWESVLFGVGIVVGFTLGGAVLYGLSWVVFGAVWLFIGDDSPIVRAWRQWRKL